MYNVYLLWYTNGIATQSCFYVKVSCFSYGEYINSIRVFISHCSSVLEPEILDNHNINTGTTLFVN